MFSIKSTSSSREIIFNNRNGDDFQVKIEGNVEAAVNICAYTDKNGLNELFQKLGSFSKPWEDELSWESLEADFKLLVSCSAIGEVRFHITLWAMHGSPVGYRIEVGLVSEFGQLGKLAKHSQAFFS